MSHFSVCVCVCCFVGAVNKLLCHLHMTNSDELFLCVHVVCCCKYTSLPSSHNKFRYFCVFCCCKYTSLPSSHNKFRQISPLYFLWTLGLFLLQLKKKWSSFTMLLFVLLKSIHFEPFYLFLLCRAAPTSLRSNLICFLFTSRMSYLYELVKVLQNRNVKCTMRNNWTSS